MKKRQIREDELKGQKEQPSDIEESKLELYAKVAKPRTGELREW